MSPVEQFAISRDDIDSVADRFAEPIDTWSQPWQRHRRINSGKRSVSK